MVKGFPFLVLVLVSEFRFSFRKTCDLCSKRVECFFFCKVESLYVFFVSFLCLLWSFLAFFGLLWSFLVFFARTLSFYNTRCGSHQNDNLKDMSKDNPRCETTPRLSVTT